MQYCYSHTFLAKGSPYKPWQKLDWLYFFYKFNYQTALLQQAEYLLSALVGLTQHRHARLLQYIGSRKLC